MPPFPSFVGGAYASASPMADQEELINRYIEVMEMPGASAATALYPTPGVETLATLSAVGGRANFFDDTTQRGFAVYGSSFVEYDAAWTITVRGTVAVDGNPATISTNGEGGGQLLITSGDKAYSYDLATNTLTEELSSGATMGAVLYGYGLVFDKATGRVQLSDLFDLTTWDPTQYFERTIGTDPWQAMHVTPYGYIVLPGTQTGEHWYNADTFPIPFAPDPSGNFARGIAATFSIQQMGDDTVWLASAKSGGYEVVRAPGFSPQRISTHPVELAIAGYDTIDDAIGQSYAEQGHLFYLLSFPTANVTWQFDASVVGKANPWAKRLTWVVEETRFIYWRPVFHAFAYGVHVMADRDSNVLYRMANDLPLDVDGRPIRWLRRSPALIDENRRLLHTWFELLMQVGVGTSGQGLNPVVMLRYSDDGGRTWSNELTCGVGAMGAYSTRVYWTRLGQARQRVYEVSGSDPVPYRISDAFIRVKASTEGREAA